MTAVPNPFYDPDWAQKHRAAVASCAAWQTACDQIAAAEGFGSRRHLAAMAGQRDAAAARDKAALSRHRTIADYAAARFATLPPARDGAALVPDFTTFTSIAAVDAAYNRALARATENPFIDEMSLPVRQPPGLPAFADPASVITSPRRFAPAELGLGPAADALDCVVTFQELAGPEYHFCIAHRWGDLSSGAGDQFKTIATILARQAIGFTIPEAQVIFEAGNHGLVQYRALIRQVNELAAKFRFYRHLLPVRDLKEQFCRVAMAWNGARFIEPDFSTGLFDSIPPVLRAAADRLLDPPGLLALPEP